MKQKKKKVLLWKVNKPVKHFMGDKDGDGVMNMFDCAPNNPRKQGPQHMTKDNYGFKMVYKQPRKFKTSEEILEELEEEEGKW